MLDGAAVERVATGMRIVAVLPLARFSVLPDPSRSTTSSAPKLSMVTGAAAPVAWKFPGIAAGLAAGSIGVTCAVTVPLAAAPVAGLTRPLAGRLTWPVELGTETTVALPALNCCDVA